MKLLPIATELNYKDALVLDTRLRQDGIKTYCRPFEPYTLSVISSKYHRALQIIRNSKQETRQ